VIEYIRSTGDDVHTTTEPLDAELLDSIQPAFVVSHGYRHIIRKQILDRFPSRAINLHISYLPYNRGADPNLWSILEGTPKGVTIHYLDEGVDTGDIIAQRRVELSSEDTLRTSYAKLQEALCDLFRREWAGIRTGRCDRRRQEGTGTFHKSKDLEAVRHLLTSGWDTPIASLQSRTDHRQ